MTLADEMKAKAKQLAQAEKDAEKARDKVHKAYIKRLCAEIPGEIKTLVAEALAKYNNTQQKELYIYFSTDQSNGEVHNAKVTFAKDYLTGEGFTITACDINYYSGGNDPEWPTEASVAATIKFKW